MTARERGGALADRAVAYAEDAIERVELPEVDALGELALAVAKWQTTEVSERADDELDAAAREWSDTHRSLAHADMRAITKAIADAFVMGYQAGQDDVGRGERALGGAAEDARRRKAPGMHVVRTETRVRGSTGVEHRAICTCRWTSTWQPGKVAMATNAGLAHAAAAVRARRG